MRPTVSRRRLRSVSARCDDHARRTPSRRCAKVSRASVVLVRCERAYGSAYLGSALTEYKPAWFEKCQDELTGSVYHVYTGDYWRCKDKQEWQRCPPLF